MNVHCMPAGFCNANYVYPLSVVASLVLISCAMLAAIGWYRRFRYRSRHHGQAYRFNEKGRLQNDPTEKGPPK